MSSGRIIFDSSSSQYGHMVFLGEGDGAVFRGAKSFLGFEDYTKRRLPFFTTAEELLEEEYYDEQIPEKKRRLNTEQVHLLERSFEAENKLEPERKSELAKKLGLQPRQVAVWFQNRRARWKTKQLECDFDRLKSSFDSLVTNHDSLLKDNTRLRSQVISLTEKLREKELQLGGNGKPPGNPNLSSPHGKPSLSLNLQRGEDRLSTGSGESAILDSELGSLPADSSGESYFQERLLEAEADCCIEPALKGGLDSEQDGGISDEDCSYLPGSTIFEEAGHEDNWWVWS